MGKIHAKRRPRARTASGVVGHCVSSHLRSILESIDRPGFGAPRSAFVYSRDGVSGLPLPCSPPATNRSPLEGLPQGSDRQRSDVDTRGKTGRSIASQIGANPAPGVILLSIDARQNTSCLSLGGTSYCSPSRSTVSMNSFNGRSASPYLPNLSKCFALPVTSGRELARQIPAMRRSGS